MVEAVTSTDVSHIWQQRMAGTRVVGSAGFPVWGSEPGTLG